jgi:hypothetical protein
MSRSTNAAGARQRAHDFGRGPVAAHDVRLARDDAGEGVERDDLGDAVAAHVEEAEECDAVLAAAAVVGVDAQ